MLAAQGAPAVDGLCEIARRLRRLPALDPLLPTVRPELLYLLTLVVGAAVQNIGVERKSV